MPIHYIKESGFRQIKLCAKQDKILSAFCITPRPLVSFALDTLTSEDFAPNLPIIFAVKRYQQKHSINSQDMGITAKSHFSES